MLSNKKTDRLSEVKELLTVLVYRYLNFVYNFTFLVFLFLRAGFIVPAEEHRAAGKTGFANTFSLCAFRIVSPPEDHAFRGGERCTSFTAGIPITVDGRE